jgi:hypothetical protein
MIKVRFFFPLPFIGSLLCRASGRFCTLLGGLAYGFRALLVPSALHVNDLADCISAQVPMYVTNAFKTPMIQVTLAGTESTGYSGGLSFIRDCLMIQWRWMADAFAWRKRRDKGDDKRDHDGKAR